MFAQLRKKRLEEENEEKTRALVGAGQVDLLVLGCCYLKHQIWCLLLH